MNTWPHPGDTATDIARKVAWAYREELNKSDPDRAAELDLQMRQYGQYWVANLTAALDDDEWVPSFVAADILGVSGARMGELRRMGRLTAVKNGRGFIFRVGDLRAYKPRIIGRRDKPKTTPVAAPNARDSVSADGTRVQ